MELTRERVKNWLSEAEKGPIFGPKVVSDLCTALLAEMERQGLWDDAPEWASTAMAVWYGEDGQVAHSKDYARELPKSRERQIAEEIHKALFGYVNHESNLSIIDGILVKAKAEWEANR